MTYRDDADAMRLQIETLTHDLSAAERRADRADQEVAELRHAIVRLRAGARDEEALRADKHLLVTEALLPVAGVLGVLTILLWVTPLVIRLRRRGSSQTVS